MPYMDDYYQRTIPKLPKLPAITRTAVQQKAYVPPTRYIVPGGKGPGAKLAAAKLPSYSVAKPEGASTKAYVNTAVSNQLGMSDYYQRAVVQDRYVPQTTGDDFYRRGVDSGRITRQYQPGYMDDYYQRSVAQGRRPDIDPGMRPASKPAPYTNALEDYYFRWKLAGGAALPTYDYGGGGYAEQPQQYVDYGGGGGGGGYGAGYRPQWMTSLFSLNANRA